MQLTTTSIRELEEMNALTSQSGYTHKEVLFAAAALAYRNNPAITLNELHEDEQDWQEFCSDAENFSSCF